MTDQNFYDEQTPMAFQPTDDDYQADSQEEWSADTYQQPTGSPYRQSTGNPYPPPQGRPTHSPSPYPPPAHAVYGRSASPIPVAISPYPPPVPAVYDSGSFGWAVLGVLFPLVGFILFLSWQWRKPECAKMAGIGALVSALVALIFAVVSVFLFMAFAPTSYHL